MKKRSFLLVIAMLVITLTYAQTEKPSADYILSSPLSVQNFKKDGKIKLDFANNPTGLYPVQLFNMHGKLVNTRELNILHKVQNVELKFPEISGKGSFIIKISNEPKNVSILKRIFV